MTTLLESGMAVEVDGEGEAIVLLHGLGGTSNSWQTLMPVFAGMKTIRPDLPGAGRSANPPSEMDIEFLVATLRRALVNLSCDRFHLVGHSFGALVAQHLAAAMPGSAKSLTLFGPIVEPADGARERLRARAVTVRENGMSAVADQVTTGGLAPGSAESNAVAFAFVRESHMRQDAEGFAKSCEALAGARRADPAMLTMPALVVTGETDAIAPPQTAQGLADELQSARLTILSDCGHWTQIEQPKECARLVAGFLRETTF